MCAESSPTYYQRRALHNAPGIGWSDKCIPERVVLMLSSRLATLKRHLRPFHPTKVTACDSSSRCFIDLLHSPGIISHQHFRLKCLIIVTVAQSRLLKWNQRQQSQEISIRANKGTVEYCLNLSRKFMQMGDCSISLITRI